jgi:putative transposase
LDPARDRANILAGAAHDAVRPRSELIAENALLRQQLIVLRRKNKRPAFSDGDRIVMVLLARLDRAWRDALHLVKPDTLLRWHRDLFKLIWRRKSRSGRSQPKRLSKDNIELIMTMARDNALWGAERIRGELLKLGIRDSKRTIQKYMKRALPPKERGQT